MRRHRLFRRAHVRIIAAALVLLAGCRETRPTTYPVSGRLTRGGRPLAHADLRFYETDGQASPMARPYATTDADGRFVVSTFGMNDGAPAGQYQVSLSWKGELPGVPPDQRDAWPERLPSRYADAATSGIRVRVTPGDNALAAIELAP